MQAHGSEGAVPVPASSAGEDERYLRGMERLLQAVQELSLARELAEVQRIVRTVARELTGCDGATFVLNVDGLFCHYADEDAIEPLWKGKRFPQETCISGWVMRNRQPAVIPDIYADPRIPHEAYRPTFVKSMAMVPIRTLDPVGAIGNYWAQGHVPSAHEVHLLQTLADCTSVAMENIRVYAELERRVRQRTAELRNANIAISKFSTTDELTGLYNRRGFYQHAGAALREGRRVLLAFIDVDGLKAVNDRYGHAVGDTMLAELASVLRATFRHDDILARIGGDEFCVLVLDSAADADVLRQSFAARLDAATRSAPRPYALSASMGIVEEPSGDVAAVDRLLRDADRLMYVEKKAKRQRES